MDEDRQIRFLISPFFFYFSLLWWAFASSQTHNWLSSLKVGDLKDTLAIVAALGAATLPLGYSIGTIGILVLRLCFWVRTKLFPDAERQIYEAWLSPDAFGRVVTKLGAPLEKRSSLLYAAASYDHGLLAEGIHKWLMRRWNAFFIAFNSAFSLLISLAVVPIRAIYTGSLHRTPGYQYYGLLWCWFVTNLLLIVVLSLTAYFAWRETMGMLEFQTRRKAFSMRQ